MEDPRWGGRSPGGSLTQAQAQAAAAQAAAAERSASSFSIVFSAHWVRTTAPIGEGAFSRVYEGIYQNPETHEESVVAVKILKRNMLKRRSDCLRFIKEAKIMTKISHKNIAACYGIGKYDDDDPNNPGSLFIVQELIRGGNLLHKVYKQMLNRQKCVYTSQEALSWLINVAEGMQYLHSVVDGKPMIIHRDLKLENIMLSPCGSGTIAKLVDFGLHKVIDDRIKKVVKRVISEAHLGGRLSRARAMAAPVDEGIDEDDELEVALAEQRAMAAATAAGPGPSSSTSPVNNAGSSSRFAPARRVGGALGTSGSSSALHSHIEEEEEEEGEGGGGNGNGAAAAASGVKPSPLSRTAAGADQAAQAEGDAPAAGPVHKVRSLPKRTSSMQKLMAKMKEIKLRVTGKAGEEGAAGAAGAQPGATGSRLASASPTGPLSTTAGSEGTAGSAEGETKQARNEALLNKIIAQQSVAAAERAQMLDDLGIMDSSAPRRKPPPRRAVTWVNEVRYNLTEAVGSWAYMAPEVVLGQPYNEKVDVFSFGVILFEVLNRKLMLVDEIKNDPRKDAQAYAERVARGFRPEIPKRWPEQLSDLIQSCWAQDPHLRPNFMAVMDVLREIEASGVVSRLDLAYWQHGSVFV